MKRDSVMTISKNITEIEINDFIIYDNLTRTFTGMVSDFNDRYLYTRVYDDAADVGFFLKNPKTGRKILFVYASAKYDDECDVASYEFSAFCPTHNPADLLDLRVSLFND